MSQVKIRIDYNQNIRGMNNVFKNTRRNARRDLNVINPKRVITFLDPLGVSRLDGDGVTLSLQLQEATRLALPLFAVDMVVVG
jgi:hypothetical protein